MIDRTKVGFLPYNIWFLLFFYLHFCDFVIIEALHLFLKSKSCCDRLIISNLFFSNSLLYSPYCKAPTFHCAGFCHWWNDFCLSFFSMRLLQLFEGIFLCSLRYFGFPVYVRSHGISWDMQPYIKYYFMVFLCSWFIHQGTSPQQHNGCYNAGYGKWCEYLSYLENPQTQRGEGSISGFHRINILRDTLLKHANDAWTHILLFDDWFIWSVTM